MDQIIDDSVCRLDIYVAECYILDTRSNELIHIVLVLACRRIESTVLASIHIHYLPWLRQSNVLNKQIYQFRRIVNMWMGSVTDLKPLFRCPCKTDQQTDRLRGSPRR